MVCCVTGHRPKGFPFLRDHSCIQYLYYFDSLYNEVEKLIKCGYTDFITGMADGADMDFAECVIYYREQVENISLEAALPYPMKYSKKSSPAIDKRYDILHSCDKKHVVSEKYFKGCMQKRNRYMVDKSDIVLAIWNGNNSGGTWNTIQYARSKGKEIRYIMLNNIYI